MMDEKKIIVKVIRTGGEIQEMEMSPTDRIAVPLGTTIIGPDHWDTFVANQKTATKAAALEKIAAQLGTVASADLKKKISEEDKKKK
jgi:hypothetical protein